MSSVFSCCWRQKAKRTKRKKFERACADLIHYNFALNRARHEQVNERIIKKLDKNRELYYEEVERQAKKNKMKVEQPSKDEYEEKTFECYVKVTYKCASSPGDDAGPSRPFRHFVTPEDVPSTPLDPEK